MQERTIQAFLDARTQRPRWPGIPADLSPATLDEAYALQQALHLRLGAQGIPRLGYKVGSTSPAGQHLFGLDEPVYAGIFADGRAPSLAAALAQGLAQPSLECEIALILRTDLDGADPDLTAARIADAVGSCHIACEIIDNRYGDPRAVGVPSLIADDFFHAGFVIGARNPGWRDQDLTRVEAVIEIDGVRTTGNAGDVLSAGASLRWLARKLASVGARLHAGDIVLTGAIAGPVRIAPPVRAVALRIAGFAPLALPG